MANRYWMGNQGLWSDSSHWSTESNGTGGASVPTSADNVYFDQYSFTSTGQIVTVDTAANCLDMDWTGVTNSPTITGTYNLSIYGSLIFISTMNRSLSGSIYFLSTTIDKTVTTGGSLNGNIVFDGVGGEWTLQDDLIINNGSITLSSGSLTTNGKAISCSNFKIMGGNATKSLTLETSIITVSASWYQNGTNLTLISGASTIIQLGNSSVFYGFGLTYHNVELQGDNITISGSNTFNDLKLTAGKTVNFTAGTTQTVTTLTADGATLQSSSAGSPFTISKASGTTLLNNCSIKDSTTTGGAKFLAKDSTNVSGNTGWIFAPIAQLAPATTSVGGFLSAEDKTKLDNANFAALSLYLYNNVGGAL